MTAEAYRSVDSRDGWAYSGLEYYDVHAPVVGLMHGDPRVISLSGIPVEQLVWQRDASQYGVRKGKLPLVPPSTVPTLFSDDSMKNLNGAIYSIYRDIGLLIQNMEPVVFGFDLKGGPVPFVSWDAGIQFAVKVDGITWHVFAPAVISMDHPNYDRVKEGRMSLSRANALVHAHMNQLRESFYQLVGINMPELSKTSNTGGAFVNQAGGYERVPFKIDNKPFELHLFESYPALVDLRWRDPKQFRNLVIDKKFLDALIRISIAWDQNFMREFAKWPKEYLEANTKLAQDIADYLNNEFDRIDQEALGEELTEVQ